MADTADTDAQPTGPSLEDGVVPTLQSITNPAAGMTNTMAHIRTLIDAALRTALIEIDGHPSGTGVLIAEDLLLTASHVVSRDAEAGEPHIVAVFDYVEGHSRSPAETGVRVLVAEIVVDSLPAPEERDSQASTSPPASTAEASAEYLDFAILRLASRPPHGSDLNGHATFRSYYQLDPTDYDLSAADLSIVQHPLGGTQQYCRLTSPRWNETRTRIRYDGNTIRGSSGAPIVDHRGRLVAIHHYGGRRNQGIPVSAIARLLRSGPHSHLLPDTAAQYDLAQPLTVRSRASAQPFEPLDEWSSAFGDDSTCPYKPTRLEYTQGAIQVRDQLVQDVTKRLQSGCCLLQGRGTVGKTTLALFVGLRHNSDGGTTYYLDFTEDPLERLKATLVLDSMSAVAGDSTLFILDNVHTDESLAHTLYRHWQRHGAGSQLLLVGRAVSRTTRATIEGSGLARLESDAVILDVTEDDLLLTYQRLARINVLNDAGSAPSPTTVAAWLTLFASDRIAFVTAVRRYLEGRDPQRWFASGHSLTANDAINYIKEEYLDPYPGAWQPLIQLAAASTVEMGMPDELVAPGVLRGLMAAGIVHTTTHGKGSHRRYTLTHPGLGHLIAKATRTRDTNSVLTELTTESPKFGFALASRLDQLGRRTEATEILLRLASDPQLMASGLYEIRVAYSIFRRMANHKVLTYKQMDNELCLVDVPPMLMDSVALDLGSTRLFLEFLERRMPMFAQQQNERLTEPSLCADVADAVANQLGHAAEFLEFAAKYLPDVANLLRPLLVEKQRLNRIADAIPNHLGNATEFLEFAAEYLPDVANLLRPLLVEKQRLNRIADVIPNNLGNATEFLEFAAEYLPDVANLLRPLLVEEQRLNRIADAVPNDLGNATRFLEYMHKDMQTVTRQIAVLLAEPKMISRIIDVAPRSFEGLLTFLQFTFAQMLAVAERATVELADPRHAPVLAERAKTSGRSRGALYRVVELADLHHPDVARPLWTVLDPDESP